MSITAADALDSARVYLNDVGKQIWTDVVLLPYLKEAYRDLLLELELQQIPILRSKSTATTVNIGDTTVTLPSDFVLPIKLTEKSFGSSDAPTPMVECDFEPAVDATDTLRYWAFRNGVIDLVGSTTKRSVYLYYESGPTIPTAAGSSLGITNAEIFLGPQTAGYAAGSVGNRSLAVELLFIKSTQLGIAGGKLESIIRANVKNQQNLPARRIPYHRGGRRGRILSL